MEQKIPAFAQAEEVSCVGDLCHLGIAVRSHRNDVLPTSANALRGRGIALLGNQGPPENDVLARDLTIEADLHEPSWTQKVHQDPPAGQWIAKMVKDATTFNEIKLPSNITQLHDVALGVFYI